MIFIIEILCYNVFFIFDRDLKLGCVYEACIDIRFRSSALFKSRSEPRSLTSKRVSKPDFQTGFVTLTGYLIN